MSFILQVARLFAGGAAYVIADDEEIDHPRKAIRDFYVARFREATVDPSQVYSQPSAPVQARPDDRKLPALNVFTLDESSARVAKRYPLDRALDLVVDVLEEGEDVGDLLDQYALVVESIMALEIIDEPDLQTLPSTSPYRTVREVTLISSTLAFSSEGDRKFGSVRLVYSISYETELGA